MQEGDYLGERIILECPKCGHRWLEKVQLPMRVEAFVARAKGFGVCPSCANKKGTVMLVGEKFREAIKQFELKEETKGVIPNRC